jgi:hypothetical protein
MSLSLQTIQNLQQEARAQIASWHRALHALCTIPVGLGDTTKSAAECTFFLQQVTGLVMVTASAVQSASTVMVQYGAPDPRVVALVQAAAARRPHLRAILRAVHRVSAIFHNQLLPIWRPLAQQRAAIAADRHQASQQTPPNPQHVRELWGEIAAIDNAAAPIHARSGRLVGALRPHVVQAHRDGIEILTQLYRAAEELTTAPARPIASPSEGSAAQQTR